MNAAEPKSRQRFTIAHELGHFLMHRDAAHGRVVDDIFFRSSLSDGREAEANQFAAELLMPLGLINSYIEQGIKTPFELAERFGVSEIAMSIRLGLPT